MSFSGFGELLGEFAHYPNQSVSSVPSQSFSASEGIPPSPFQGSFRGFYGVPKLPKPIAITEIRLPGGSSGIRQVSSICWVKSWVTAFRGNSPKVSDSRSSRGICWVKRCLEQARRGQTNCGSPTNSNGIKFASRQTEASDALLTQVLGAVRAVIEVDIELM